VPTGVKTVKGGKTEDEFDHRTIKLRGVEYTIKELDVVQYKEALKAATDEKTGMTPFQDLLDVMVLKCVSPSPAARSKPMPYPVYRTLENIVNEMHFITLDEDKADKPAESEEGEGDGDGEEQSDPNS